MQVETTVKTREKPTISGCPMTDNTVAPARVRRVGNELKVLRSNVGLSQRNVVRILGMSPSKLSRLESGHRNLRADDVSALLGLYRVPTERREQLLAAVRDGRDRNWWQVDDDRLPQLWRDLMGFEREATAIRNWEPLAMPGLLQTEEYADAVIRASIDGLSDAEVQFRVSARVNRQQVLSQRDAPGLEVLIDEMVLRRPIGDQAVQRRQLELLVRASQRENITIRVVPFAAGVHPGTYGPLALFQFPKYPSLIFLEHGDSAVFLEEPQHVAKTEQVLRSLRRLALSGDDSAEIIARVADEMT
jgi:transcriptional regulator with XRE-family HTH domain